MTELTNLLVSLAVIFLTGGVIAAMPGLWYWAREKGGGLLYFAIGLIWLALILTIVVVAISFFIGK